MYLAVAEKQGADWKHLSGTLQNDILKEYIAQKEYIYPPEPSMRLVIDTIEFGARAHAEVQSDFDQRLPHSRGRLDGHSGAGVHAARRHRVRRAVPSRAGLQVDEFAPRLSFFFNAHNDFFEEIAKYRAARRIWEQRDARALRREESALLGAALPRADGRAVR